MTDDEKTLLKAHILSRFGGPSAVAEICGVSTSAISQWEIIPAVHQMALYRHARDKGIEFNAEEFHVIPNKKLINESCLNA